jgi:hypothetical protein
MTRTVTVLILAVAQLVVSVALIATDYALGMSRFDTGAPPGLVERVVEATARVLLFPIVTACLASGLRLPGPVQYLPFLLNGLLWAMVLVRVVPSLRRLGKGGGRTRGLRVEDA